jgi:hypothetical protein
MMMKERTNQKLLPLLTLLLLYLLLLHETKTKMKTKTLIQLLQFPAAVVMDHTILISVMVDFVIK